MLCKDLIHSSLFKIKIQSIYTPLWVYITENHIYVINHIVFETLYKACQN